MKARNGVAGHSRSFGSFIGIELGLTAGSFILAWFIGNLIYPLAPWLFTMIGQLLPQPLSATGFQMAYIIGAGLVWLVSNVLLFASGLRRI